MTDTAQAIATRIKSAGRSVTGLSTESGIAEKTLRRRLAAPEHFTLSELAALARVTGIELEDLLASAPAEVA